MASKDIKPKQRIGQGGKTRARKLAGWALFLVLAGGAAYAAYRRRVPMLLPGRRRLGPPSPPLIPPTSQWMP